MGSLTYLIIFLSGCGSVGRSLHLGCRGRQFESGHPDIIKKREIEEFGRPRLPWTQEIAGSNPAFPTKKGAVV